MQKSALLYDASQVVLSTFDLDEVLERILAVVREYFQIEHAGVFLVEGEQLCLRTHYGRRKVADLGLPLGQGLTGSAATEKRTVYVPDVRRDARYIPNIRNTRSELAIPLTVRGQVAGVLDFQSDQVDYFSAETIDLLELFAAQASIAIENARLYSLEQRRAAQLEAINTIARQTTSVLDLDELLARLCELIRESFPVDHASVLLVKDGSLVVRHQSGPLRPRLRRGARLSPGRGLCDRAIEMLMPVVENGIAQSSNHTKGQRELRSEVCLPLVHHGQPLGVLSLGSRRAGAFQADEVTALQSLADICANAIQNARYYEQARRLADVDGLTGVYNRRILEHRLAQELERAARYRSTLALIMVDIDHFKRLNDEYGHLAGDQVLREAASLFARKLRKVDVVCRYGGEEFALLVPGTTGMNAVGVAEKLRRAVEKMSFPGVPRRVTISLGVADYPRHGRTREQLLDAADSALYAAKQAGRNRVRAAAIRTRPRGVSLKKRAGAG